MSASPLSIVILGLSITSSWGNGHATNYRGLVRALDQAGHRVLFLERDAPWYAENRDFPSPPYGRTALYSSLEELYDRFAPDVRDADLVMVGSYVPQGAQVGRWVTSEATGVTAFYDIDTPVTLAKLDRGDWEYLSPDLVSRYHLYLSFTGGPTLERLTRQYGSPWPLAFYCSVDPALYYPEPHEPAWDLGYLGTYSPDRQPALERLMLEPADAWPQGRFVVAGPQYPEDASCPDNVSRVAHLAPGEHRAFYCSQRFTLSITRADMMRTGFSPSVRLFEAAACATPIVSDPWPGIEQFFQMGREVLVARSCQDVLDYLCRLPEEERRRIGQRARERVLARHTSEHRAEELVQNALEVWRCKA